jgi:hypothetical protein
MIVRYIGHNVYGVDIEALDEIFTGTENKRLPKAKNRLTVQNDIELRYLNEDDEYDNHIEGLCAYAIELISILVTKPALYNLIKFGTFPLLNTLSTFITATRSQVLLRFISGTSMDARARIFHLERRRRIATEECQNPFVETN